MLTAATARFMPLATRLCPTSASLAVKTPALWSCALSIFLVNVLLLLIPPVLGRDAVYKAEADDDLAVGPSGCEWANTFVALAKVEFKREDVG